ncbi:MULTISPECIES: BolA family transcriptional regulator [Acidiphilium]|jgi:BolA protein|uniref:Uncharacterized protein n=1 Tax=Acidiphilium multivorum (strain DSM 11245 / JCM 8867 / NBRC 100883 / AIU 301) TaxID=926570 RepID=F0IZ95_ACIMA|nr:MULTISPECIES: BolA family protein [Acidiphilium]MBU6356283.1 BolA family transcriptional regulator [Rhodospirillales bacterium]EGO94788.1 BolA family protein [Acidiphilium sp. PM]KDM65200.1 BolA family protein [Acidiphilium sp. JA12-A1]MDE2326590.1 BolA family transcriptional regulator [Rhodospirillales bacterium]BAJ81105.1 hypothetical protein ACMV_17580 [Acidiphilium multivorum AIU301]
MTSRSDRIRAILAERFAPGLLELKDDSAKHASHIGRMTGPGHAPEAGETHYRLKMVAEAFRGMNRVARQRAVNEALKAEFETGLHALSLDLKTPDEA